MTSKKLSLILTIAILLLAPGSALATTGGASMPWDQGLNNLIDNLAAPLKPLRIKQLRGSRQALAPLCFPSHHKVTTRQRVLAVFSILRGPGWRSSGGDFVVTRGTRLSI